MGTQHIWQFTKTFKSIRQGVELSSMPHPIVYRDTKKQPTGCRTQQCAASDSLPGTRLVQQHT